MTVIYPGSFDPVHYGHLQLAQFVARQPEVDAVWMMPSRRNPLKSHDVIADDADRLEMLHIAVEEMSCGPDADIAVSDLELSLSCPSYTINTLHELARRFPDRKFRLLIGSDNWPSFGQWRQAGDILAEFGLVVYPRPGYSDMPETSDNIMALSDEAPLFPQSSTEVRYRLRQPGFPEGIVPEPVLTYIRRNNLYL